MSDVQFRFNKVENRGGSAVYEAESDAQETVTSSGTVANSTAVASDGNLYCRVTNSGSDDVYAAVGVNAVASAANGMLVIAGTTVDVANVAKGARGSVVNK